ncbi:MAG: cation diffusion facilitator family transporter [Candidatus Methanoplasma sp.]|jgi:cation diffusion facilitator family transporter|nr:cation diffusion facilitator family transporter [Candidatus Methanoplasma sp.]
MNDVSSENYNFQKIVVIVGASLLVMKFAAYFITNSVAIFTDAVESIVNVVAGVIGLYALYLSAQPADRSHPFGHGRVELISATVEGAMIAVAGVLIILEAVNDLMNPKEISSLDIGLLLIILAAGVNFVVGTAAVRKGKKNRSMALEASGRHLRTDTVSSAGIIIGLTIVYLGARSGYDLYILDPIIALVFGALIMITGARVIKKAMDGIMDKADAEILEKAVVCLSEHRSEAWIDIHNLRVIKYGSKLHIEMHVTMPFDMTISQMEEENSRLHGSVGSTFGGSVDLIMMPEPCKEFSCIHCSRDCRARRAEFIERINWNVDLLAQEHQHAYGNHVVIRDPGKR